MSGDLNGDYNRRKSEGPGGLGKSDMLKLRLKRAEAFIKHGPSDKYSRRCSAPGRIDSTTESVGGSGCLREQRKKYFLSKGFPKGLSHNFRHRIDSCAMRIWLIDNSADMSIRDGIRIKEKDGNNFIEKVEGVTRWEESRDCLAFHAQMAAACWMPTKYRFLNETKTGSRKVGLCETKSGEDVEHELMDFRSNLTGVAPKGPCALAKRVRKAAATIEKEAPRLLASNKTATLVINTQGLATDEQGNRSAEVLKDFVNAIKTLDKLPVRTVIRLCTNNERAAAFFNKLDGKLKYMPYDVLDDFYNEALEVFLVNPWITYGLPLHRLRESGIAVHDVMGDVDDKPLSLKQVHKFCSLLLMADDGYETLPDPLEDWTGFLDATSMALAKEELQWNSVTKGFEPWVNVKRLHSIYGAEAFAQKVSRSKEDTTHDRVRRNPRLGRNKLSQSMHPMSTPPPSMNSQHVSRQVEAPLDEHKEQADFSQTMPHSMYEDPTHDRVRRNHKLGRNQRSQSMYPQSTPPPSVHSQHASRQAEAPRDKHKEQADFSQSMPHSMYEGEAFSQKSPRSTEDPTGDRVRHDSKKKVPLGKTKYASYQEPSTSMPLGESKYDSYHPSASSARGQEPSAEGEAHFNRDPPPLSSAGGPKKPTSRSCSDPFIHKTPAQDYNEGTVKDLEERIMKAWGKQPPNYKTVRPACELLGTLQDNCFPPALGVEPHDYFHKWKPFSADALSSGNQLVTKRAARKAKFFLHPDKLPKDLTEKQDRLFKVVWTVLAEAEAALN